MAYYVSSNNDVTVELTTALPTSGLQLLAYYRFVSGPNASYSKGGWNAKTTEEQIRLLLDDADIDTNVPNHMSDIFVGSGKAICSQTVRRRANYCHSDAQRCHAPY